MTSLSLLALCLGVGPLADPELGKRLDAGDRELLPSARSLPSIADLWFAEVTSLQPTTDLGHFDAPYTSAHGRSWAQQRYFLNGVEATDPARPGQPLFTVPYLAWDELRHASLFTALPGWSFEISPEGAGASLAFGTGGDVGGGTWVPRGLMDREPATHKGAPHERRRLQLPLELTVQGGATGEQAAVRLIAERLQHRHAYLTLEPTDFAERTTVMAIGRATLGALPLSGTLVWQGEERSAAGAELRWPEPFVLRTEASAAWAGLESDVELDARTRLKLSAGIGRRRQLERRHSEGPLVTDLEDEWTWLGRPRYGSRTQSHRLDAAGTLELGDLELSARVSRGGIVTRPFVPALSGVTYDGEPADEASPAPLYVTRWAPAGRAEEVLQSGRADVAWRGAVGPVALHAVVAWDYAAAGTPGGASVGGGSPAAGLLSRLPLGEGEVFLALRREPEAPTQQAAAFIDPVAPSGHVYRWADDGDGVPEPGEEGALVSRTGGLFHDVDPDLRRPATYELAFGGTTPRFGPFRLNATAVGRWLVDRYTVVLDAETQAAYSEVVVHDPGGDGRGETPAPGGGQDLTAYARDASSFGRERYVLTNAELPDFYLGFETQLFLAEARSWFLSVGGAAYLSQGDAPFGSFPDRNDPGVIDESSADPNQQALARGRYDHDRSFGLNLLAGWNPLPEALLSMVLRYRDGQPFTRIFVAEALPQGPTALMAVRRSKPRHTFHMEVVLRAAYRVRLDQYEAALGLDLINALGSGTEILEDPRTGPTFRDPLEMVPGRAVFVTLALGAARQ